MPEDRLQACAYRVLRYTPNLVRDEWVNIGVLLYDPAGGRFRLRMVEEEGEFARVRRLQPGADEELLRNLQGELESQFALHREGTAAFLAKLDDTLSNALQLSPQRGVLTEDFDAELDRLYRDHVEPPRFRAAAAEALNTRSGIRARIHHVFRSAGVLARMERGVRVDPFTFAGDPLRLDYAYRRNGTRGFVHALALGRDPGQAKVLAFTAERIRAKVSESEFLAVTETAPRPEENERHKFISGLLAGQGISLVPVTALSEWASRLRPTLH